MEEMVPIEGGAFLMGSDRHYPEEASQQRAAVDAFLIDPAPVTNRQFAAFVKTTGHVTVAGFRARWVRGAHSSAQPIAAAATGRRRGMRR